MPFTVDYIRPAISCEPWPYFVLLVVKIPRQLYQCWPYHYPDSGDGLIAEMGTQSPSLSEKQTQEKKKQVQCKCIPWELKEGNRWPLALIKPGF